MIGMSLRQQDILNARDDRLPSVALALKN